jgi:hypothetical protein
MATNILSLPLVGMTIITGNNEDFIESIKFIVGSLDPAATIGTLPQLDLRGIQFEMEVRRRPGDHEVILNASTVNRWMGIGPTPNYGYLLLQVPITEMQTKLPGAYVADIVASDDDWSRKVFQIDLTIVEGITR